MRTFIEIFSGGADIDLAIVPTGKLVQAAKEVRGTVQRRNANPKSDVVETEEDLMSRYNRLVNEIKSRDKWRNWLSSTPFPSQEQIHTIMQETAFDSTVPEELRQKLAELQRAFENDNAEMAKYFPAEALKAFQASQGHVNEMAATGGDVAGHQHKSLELYYDEYRVKLNAYKSASMRHTTQARELVLPIVQEFIRAVAEVAASHESRELRLCELYHVEFKPSPLLALFKKTLVALEDGAIPHGGSPKEWASFII